MITVGYNIYDGASPALKARIDSLSPEACAHKAVGDIERLFKKHFNSLPPNKRGWKSTNFWPRAAKSTGAVANGGAVRVTISQLGVRQRLQGGPIRPISAKMLAIPVSPQAYGHVPSDFPGSFIIRTKRGAYIVQYGGAVTKTGKGQRTKASLEFLFKLSAGVNQLPNPNVLPTDDEVFATAEKAILN